MLTIKKLSNYGISNTLVSYVPGNQNFLCGDRSYKCDIEVKNPLALSLNRDYQYEPMRCFIFLSPFSEKI